MTASKKPQAKKPAPKKAPAKKQQVRRNASDSLYVTRTQSFTARIVEGRDGNRILRVSSPAWYRHQLNKFPAGTKGTLEFHTQKPKRTDQQNRYYWGVYLPLIAKETGEHDLDGLHELFKGKFLTEGIVEILGQKVRKKKSTTELGIAEFSEFIMNIEAETGIEAPPTENYGLEPLGTNPNIHSEPPATD